MIAVQVALYPLGTPDYEGVISAAVAEPLLASAGRVAGGVGVVKQTVCYKQVEGCELNMDLFHRPGFQSAPVILWIHGGALIFGDRGMLPEDQLQHYLSAGYAVAALDYRLAPEAKLPEIIDDLKDGYRWLRKHGPDHFPIDPGAVALVGHSAGGYLALMGGTCLQPRPRALVSFYGYGEITADWYCRPDMHYLQQGPITRGEAYRLVGKRTLSGSPLSPRVLFYIYCRQQGIWPREVRGYDPVADPAQFDAFCPVRHVSQEYPPTLLLHGDCDTDVPFQESVRMAEALAQHRVSHKLLRAAGADHLFDVYPEGLPPKGEALGLKHPTVSAAFDEVTRFLNEHLGAQNRLA